MLDGCKMWLQRFYLANIWQRNTFPEISVYYDLQRSALRMFDSIIISDYDELVEMMDEPLCTLQFMMN